MGAAVVEALEVEAARPEPQKAQEEAPRGEATMEGVLRVVEGVAVEAMGAVGMVEAEWGTGMMAVKVVAASEALAVPSEVLVVAARGEVMVWGPSGGEMERAAVRAVGMG